MFLRERDAEQWLSVVESELLRGEWIDPWLSEVELVDFGQRWIKEHALEPRSRDDYEGMFRDHVEPHLGALAVGEISTATVRHWRTTLLDGGMTGNRAAKVHRLLRAILDTAVDDGMVERNPCRTKGPTGRPGAAVPSALRPQMYALADAVPHRFRALVLLGALTGLRWGELVDLRRSSIDTAAGVVHVTHTLSERDNGRSTGVARPSRRPVCDR